MIVTLNTVTDAALLLIYALAVARLSVLITEDKITERPRAALLRRWAGTSEHPRNSYRAYLLVCQWCISMWLAAAAAPIWYYAGDAPWALIPAAALAMSYITGSLARIGG